MTAREAARLLEKALDEGVFSDLVVFRGTSRPYWRRAALDRPEALRRAFRIIGRRFSLRVEVGGPFCTRHLVFTIDNKLSTQEKRIWD